MINTRVNRLFGVKYPVMQGGMAWVADGNLAGAVSAGGGLGVIACGAAPLAWIEAQVVRAREITGNPIGANVMLMNPNAAEIAELLARLRVDVITTGAGSPSAYIGMWKEAGCKVVPVVASAALASRMERCGADAVVAEGCEAGGHIGELTTMALVPAVCDAVSIPVIAAGGIADARGVAAAFALGAEGVQVGTRFLTVDECGIADAYKEKVLAAKDSDTIVTGRRGGHPVRGLKNKFARSMRAMEDNPAVDAVQMEGAFAGSLRRAVEGDVAQGSLMAGQVACLVHERKTAAAVLAELMEGGAARAALDLQAMADANAARKMCGAQGDVAQGECAACGEGDTGVRGKGASMGVAGCEGAVPSEACAPHLTQRVGSQGESEVRRG